MVANFDRYYQIVKCFRDEDLRADRQPEFTQIDCETSFLTEQEIRDLFEAMIRHVFKETIGVELDEKFPVMQYSEAMRRFGSDKPDLRVKLEFTDLTDAVKDVDFKVFSTPANTKDGRVAALRVPKGGELSRGEIDGYTEFVRIYGAKGLAWIKVNDVAKGRDGLQCPIVKNLHDAAIARDSRAHRRARRRHHLLRGGPREGGERQPRRAASEDRPLGIRQGERPARDRLEAAVGGRLPDVRIRRGRQPLRRRASSVHEPEGRAPRVSRNRSGPLPREGLRHGAERLGDRRRFGAYPPRRSAEQGVPRAQDRRGRSAARSSASCSTRCSTARRRTAVSRSASTASSR